METTTTKVCSRCGRELPLAQFNKNARNRDGHQSECRQCTSAYMREYNKRKTRIQGAKYSPTHSQNPKFADKTPRELQQEMRELKAELIARGFNVEVECTFLHKINI